MENKPTILIIDDEQGLRDMLSFALQKEGYIVLTAENGMEGLKKVTEQKIDMVITDIKMPEMDGITVLGKIKEIKPDIEVIVATGYGTMETAIEALRKGAYDFINKPFNLDELSALLSKAYETKQLKSKLVSLEELDRLKDEFFSMVTHDLRTPLMAISGTLELILSDEQVSDETKLDFQSERNKKLLLIIHRNTERIRALVNNLLDFAKMEAGCWQLKKQDISVISIINDSINGVQSLADNKKISITKHISLIGHTFKSDEILVNCDYEQVERVLTNLIANSIKYTREAGRINVYFEKIDKEIKFVVEDNGKGITKENLGKVFDKFYRVDPSLKKEESGFGIGLSICKRVVELHKGKIYAESEGLAKGSRFIFTIPIR
ncbi:MAG: response regulator [Elusimicrobia bacterium]|nr:response regulator [Elusimicrobiota bacterium]